MLERKGSRSRARTSALLKPLFTLPFIERINKALGSGATFTAPSLLLVALKAFGGKQKPLTHTGRAAGPATLRLLPNAASPERVERKMTHQTFFH